MKQKKIYCMALGIAAYVLASGCGSESTARSVATPLWLKEGEDLKDPQNLGAPVNHEGHTKIQFPGNYSEYFEDRDSTIVSLYRSCFASDALLCATMSNFPSVLSKYDLELDENKYGHVDPNWLMAYFESAHDQEDFREGLLQELWSILMDDATEFDFTQVSYVEGDKQEAYTYDLCYLPDEVRPPYENHFVLHMLPLKNEALVKITYHAEEPEAEAAELLMKHGFAPCYR